MKSPRTNQVRTKRRARSEAELGQVHDVGYNFRLQPELCKDINEVPRRNNQHAHSAEHRTSRAESPQVIASFPTVIVEQTLLLSQKCYQPCGNGCQQERP